MTQSTRRQALRLCSGMSVVGLAGCLGTLGGGSSDTSPTDSNEGHGADVSCDKYVYESQNTAEDGELPWHVEIRNIDLSSSTVAPTISDLSGETPEVVASCEAVSEEHSELTFDLSPDTKYRIDVTLKRDDRTEEATTTVSGWNRVTGPNEALRVSVDNGEFKIRRVHYDPGKQTPYRKEL